MDLKQFEDSINKKFKDFEPEVDSLKIWDNIEDDLPTAKRTKPYWLITLLLIPVGLYYFGSVASSTNEELATNNKPVVEFKQEATPVQEKESVSIAADLVSNDKIEVTKTLDSKSIQTKVAVGQNITKQIEEEQLVTNTNAIQTKVSPVKKTAEALSEKQVTFAEAKKTQVEESKAVFNKEKDTKLAVEENLADQSAISTTSSNEAITEKVDLDAKVANDEKANEAETISPGSISQNELKEEDEVKDPIQIATGKGLEKDPTQNQQDEHAVSNLANPIDDQAIDQNFERFQISVLSGVFGSNRIYEDVSTPEAELTIAQKETAEQQLETIQFETELRYALSKKLSIGVGLRHWNLTQKSLYTTEREYTGFVDVVTGITHHADGSTTETTSPVPVQYHELVNNTRYLRHKIWSVPLRLYFKVIEADRFDLELGGGYEYSISGKHIGYELDANATEYFVTQDPDAQYNKNGGNYLLLNINTNYELKNSLSLTAGLEGKYGLTGFNSEAALYRKKYHFFGAYAGLTYSF